MRSNSSGLMTPSSRSWMNSSSSSLRRSGGSQAWASAASTSRASGRGQSQGLAAPRRQRLGQAVGPRVAQRHHPVHQREFHVLAVLGGLPHQVMEVAGLGRHLGLDVVPAPEAPPDDIGAQSRKPREDPGAETQDAGEPHQGDDEDEGNGDEKDQQAVKIGQVPQNETPGSTESFLKREKNLPM